jgi:hypothetical protein
MALGESQDRLRSDRVGCPDPERLAEYVDGTLGAGERAAVEEHLAGCADCREILAETSAFVRQEAAAASAPGARVLPFRRRWPVVAGAVAAAAAAVALVVRVDPSLMSRLGIGSGDPAFSELVAAAGGGRPVDGRLTGGFQYGPLEPVTRGAGETTRSVELLSAAATLEERARMDASARNLHSWGVAQLHLRNPEDAVKLLETARQQDAESAAIAVDLAIAYADAAARLEEADLLPKALALLDGVLARNPRMPEALFTRATVLERLDRPAEAADAWRAFLAVDSTSPWAAEAQARLTRLQATP